jgi:hypothetical protein
VTRCRYSRDAWLGEKRLPLSDRIAAAVTATKQPANACHQS